MRRLIPYHRSEAAAMKLFRKSLPESARLPGLPVAIDYMLDKSYAKITIVEELKDVRDRAEYPGIEADGPIPHYRQVLIDEDPSRPDDFRFWDGYKIREAFLSVRGVSEMKTFLSACGPFKAIPDALDQSGITSDDLAVTWPEFLRWQQYVRMCMRDELLMPPHLVSDNEHFAFQGKLRWELDRLDAGSLQMRISCDSALEAMAATIYLDKRRGIIRRLCLNVDCDNDFVVPHAGVKLYCSHECSHKAGQRRRRAKARLSKGDVAASREIQ